MEEDLHLTGNRYTWLLTIFYISYTLFEFLALMWKIMPPHRWAAITVMTWYVQTYSIKMPRSVFLTDAGALLRPAKPQHRTGAG